MNYPSTRRKVARMIEQRYSRKRIADELGVSQRFIERTAATLNSKEPRAVDAYLCPGCRNMVTYKPCLLCRTRSYSRARKLGAMTAGLAGEVSRELEVVG